MGLFEVIVLDTHIVIWLAQSPEMLSPAARAAIQQERAHGLLGISDMTLLELARTITGGKVSISTPLPSFLKEVEQNFHILPVTSEIAALTMSFSSVYPRDPVDRIIGATALAHSCRLITKDGPIRKSGEVDCVW